MKRLTFVLAVLALSSTAAHAAGPGTGYLGVSVGHAKVDDGCTGGEVSCRDSALALRVYGGREFNRFVGVEVGYRYAGEFKVRDNVFVSGYGNVDVSGAINAHLADASLQLSFPETGAARFHTKLGLMFWRLNTTATASDSGYSASASDSDSGVAFRTGLGLSYLIDHDFRLKADWDYLVGVGDSSAGAESDIHVFSVGPEILF